MAERKFELLEKYLDDNLTPGEKAEFEKIKSSDPAFGKEAEEQKKTREVLKKMTLKNPSGEFWDKYWNQKYNKIERSVAWLLIIIGAVVITGYALINAVEQMVGDTTLPGFIKAAILIALSGTVILIISLIRERITTSKRDQYKEIRR